MSRSRRTRTGRRPRRLVAAATTALAAFALAACGTGDEMGDEPPGAAHESSVGAEDGTADDATAAVVVSTLDGGSCPDDTVGADHPDVVGARFTPVTGSAGAYDVSVTLCSLYDSPTRYADAWRVRTPDGEVLATRELLHDHAGEQPFTRSLAEPVTVPEGVDTVVVEGRDQANGWGGATLEVELSDA